MSLNLVVTDVLDSYSGLLFGDFFLAMQEKVTRHQVKSRVGYYPKSQT